MKITESLLRRIIQEELSLLREKPEKYEKGDKEKIRRRVQDPYEYQFKDGKWHARKKGSGTWKDITKYKSAIEKLNKDFPDDIKKKESKPKESKPEESKPKEQKPKKPKANQEGMRPVQAGGKDPKRIAYLKVGKDYRKPMSLGALGGRQVLSDIPDNRKNPKNKKWKKIDDIAQVIVWLKKWESTKPFKEMLKAGKVNPDDVYQVYMKVGRRGVFKVAPEVSVKSPAGIKSALELATKILNV